MGKTASATTKKERKVKMPLLNGSSVASSKHGISESSCVREANAAKKRRLSLLPPLKRERRRRKGKKKAWAK